MRLTKEVKADIKIYLRWYDCESISKVLNIPMLHILSANIEYKQLTRKDKTRQYLLLRRDKKRHERVLFNLRQLYKYKKIHERLGK